MANLERVQVWAERLIALHLDASWRFEFDHAKRRAGQCEFTRRRITVSRYLAARWEDDEIYQVLLHEVAHAMAGSKAGHGPKWRKIAAELGYDGERTHHGETADELAPWIGNCPGGHEFLRHRRPARKMSCTRCHRGFSEAHLITWRRREVTARDRRMALAER